MYSEESLSHKTLLHWCNSDSVTVHPIGVTVHPVFRVFRSNSVYSEESLSHESLLAINHLRASFNWRICTVNPPTFTLCRAVGTSQAS